MVNSSLLLLRVVRGTAIHEQQMNYRKNRETTKLKRKIKLKIKPKNNSHCVVPTFSLFSLFLHFPLCHSRAGGNSPIQRNVMIYKLVQRCKNISLIIHNTHFTVIKITKENGYPPTQE
jgi:hypothetical protein